jgi:hypothetical protein
MAKVLVDENISPKTLQFLTTLGVDVVALKSRGKKTILLVSSQNSNKLPLEKEQQQYQYR